MKTAIELIAEERQGHITKEGFSITDDADQHLSGELAMAASCYPMDHIIVPPAP